MKKRRHKQPNFISNRVPVFRYTGSEGGFIFWRDVRPFNWGPVKCTREQARKLVDHLNTLRGKDIEKIGKVITENFIADIRGNNGGN